MKQLCRSILIKFRDGDDKLYPYPTVYMRSLPQAARQWARHKFSALWPVMETYPPLSTSDNPDSMTGTVKDEDTQALVKIIIGQHNQLTNKGYQGNGDGKDKTQDPALNFGQAILHKMMLQRSNTKWFEIICEKIILTILK